MNEQDFLFGDESGINQPIDEVIVLDIETIPNEAMIPLLPEPEVSIGNIKNHDLIKEKIARAKEVQIEKMALNPETGMIASFAIEGSKKFSMSLHSVCYADEIAMINVIFEYLKIDGNRTTLVTHNGMEFDLPYIYKRAMINNVELPTTLPTLDYWMKRYTTYPHCDTLKVWNNWGHDLRGASLDYLGCILLGEGKTERNYSKYLGYVQNGESDKIIADNVCDAQLTYRLYKKMKNYLF